MHDRLCAWVKDKQLHVLSSQKQRAIGFCEAGIIGGLTHREVQHSVRVHGVQSGAGEG
jgi:hypothetical protein